MLDGAKVRAAREALGLSGCAFAQLVGVNASTISKIENTNYPGIRLELAERIAWGLRTPLGALLRHVPPPYHDLLRDLPRLN